ncbi:MAG: tetratricopeptide repeat protein [Pyrinomonadaceae bacterium]|nr:tetratricopeptide repeat protein [Pyrinomonadaceae bacterium]
MGFDKSKVMRAAEKHLAQGKIPSAIKEYQQIVQFEPDDFSALNMLGDLFARTNQQEEAIKCFTRVAEHYREEGFALKAIAMFKKINRLKPGSVEIAAKLAPLYEVQGLIVDARTQYLLVADAYKRGGQAAKALEVLRKIADLDPNNTDIRLKLAEGYERENFRNDAAEAFSHAGAQFYARAAYEQALDAYTRALNIIPYDHTALSGLTSTHIALGMADEAAEILESAVSVQPDDTELLSLLAHAYVEAEDTSAAERATARLVEREPSSYMRFVEVVRLYLKADDQDSALRLLTSNVEQMLSGNQEETLAEVLNEILARNPEQMDALRLLVRLHTWQHDDEKLRGALDRLAEAAETAGLEDEERQALGQLVRLAPDETRYRERLEQLGGASEELESEEAYAAGIIEEEEVPTFESFISMNEEAAAETTGAESAQFEWNAATPQPAAADPSASFADLNDDDWATEGSAAGEADSPAPTSFQEFDFNETASEQPAVETAAPPVEPAVTAERRDAMLRQELESVDFYLAQGYADIALDTLNMLERQFGTHADIDTRRRKLGQASEVSTDAASPVVAPDASAVEATDLSDSGAVQEAPTEAKPSAPAPEEVAATPAPSRPSLDPGLAAIFDEFRTAVEEDDEMLSDGDYETHYNLGLAYKEMDLVEEAVEEFQTAASLVAPQDGTPRYLQCCNLLGHCFMQKGMPRLSVMWFKRGLEAPGHTEDEYQALRYELGTAYEKMGDLDTALDVFSEVYGVNVSYRGVADKLRELQSQKAAK